MNSAVTIAATRRLTEVPLWALQQRHLYWLIDQAWELFGDRHVATRESAMRLDSLDSADGFYEAVARWPVYYRLGGRRDVLTAARNCWDRATDDLVAHSSKFGSKESIDTLQNASLLELLFSLCAASPNDSTLKGMAVHFAQSTMTSRDRDDGFGRVDVATNLSSVLSVLNAWLHSPTSRTDYELWLRAHVTAWRAQTSSARNHAQEDEEQSRISASSGAHYRWVWPHGLKSIQSAASVAALVESTALGTTQLIEDAWHPMHVVVSNAKATSAEDCLVPHRFGPKGWFDFHPLSMEYPIWLWWLSRQGEDLGRLTTLSKQSHRNMLQPQHHPRSREPLEVEPWFEFLAGRYPSYPEDALSRAIEHVSRQISSLHAIATNSTQSDSRVWSDLNPVTVEVLLHLTTGSPLTPGHSGVQPARIVLGDPDAGRPGLPSDVAALVDEIHDDNVGLSLVNVSPTCPHTVTVQGGAFGEDRIDSVHVDSNGRHYPDAAHITVELPPWSRVHLRMQLTRWAYPCAYGTFPN